MVKFCDECIDSSDWIEEITGYGKQIKHGL